VTIAQVGDIYPARLFIANYSNNTLPGSIIAVMKVSKSRGERQAGGLHVLTHFHPRKFA
jgi:hypothetical protein